MSTHKHFDKICCVVLAVALALTVLFINAEYLGIQKASNEMGYEQTLFDTSKVHKIDIVMDDWDEFIENCTSEEYYSCSVVIDNEAYENVAIRGKGNTSLTQVAAYGNDRYSFKIEFDHYDSGNTYYGLDKLCLNNIIQDNTYMKDYIVYQMMNDMGVASSLCSYVYITVNGEDWGLYLAVEGVEESFLQRNYGNDYGELYKPDSTSMGGGRGNGEKFDMDNFIDDSEADGEEGRGSQSDIQNKNANISQLPDGDNFYGQTPENMTPPSNEDGGENSDGNQNGAPGDSGGGMMNSSDDVLLKYTDDEFDSYSNIFDNAKTDISDRDKTRLIEALKNLNNGEDLENTVDVEAVIRYFVVHNFVLNFDSYTGSMIHNYYLYEKDGQLQMIPWDYNLAFGGFQSSGGATSLVNYPIDTPVSGGSVEDRPMLAWIFENEEYIELYHRYFAEFISEYFDSGYFSEMIDSVSEMISPYVEKDPTKFCTYEEFQTGVSTLKEFCLLRAQSISGQLDGTIGSTSDTQNSEDLIDAGDLQIKDMGSMNNNTMGDNGGFGGNVQNPQTDADGGGEPDYETASEESESGENESAYEGDKSQIPKGDMQGGQMPSGEQGKTPPDFADGENGQQGNEDRQQREQSAIDTSSLIVIGVSAAVLALGIIFAIAFKRRK